MQKLIIVIILSVLSSLSAVAQYEYAISSVPDSATVIVNGEVKGHTPYLLEFSWADARNGKISIQLYSEGFDIWEEVIDRKPAELRKSSRVHMDRDIPVLDISATSAYVSFDNLMVNFKDGTPIGTYQDDDGSTEILKWEGSMKIGDSDFHERFDQILEQAGFRIPNSHAMQTGSNVAASSVPRYRVNVEITDCNIDLKHSIQNDFGAGTVIGITDLDFKWQIRDNLSGQVLENYYNSGTSKFRTGSLKSGDNIMAFEEAVIDFIEHSQLEHLVNHSNQPVNKYVPSDVEVHRSVAIVEVPPFNSLGEMIGFTKKSCVSVVTPTGHGSGAIISESGLVLSAYHVVAGVNHIEVHLADGIIQEAKVIAHDKMNDIVLLKISGKDYKPLSLAPRKEIHLGDEVITIGTPANLSLGQSVAKGILSGKRIFKEQVYLQTDIAVSPGSSGGPLLNLQGEVVGIVQRKIIDEGVEGISFALPIERALETVGVKIETP